MLIRTLSTLTACTVLACAARAEETRDNWQFRASVYGYLPEISGTFRTATPAGSEIDVDADDLVRHAKFALMGSLEATRGRWGAFTDLVYLDVGDSIDDSTSIALGSIPLPPGVTADASVDVKASAWTLAVEYQALSSERLDLDVFAGTRRLSVESETRLALSDDVGPFSGPNRELEQEDSRDGWDGIVGVKGRWTAGSHRQWFVPFYVDAGTGDADMTLQAATGIGYAARWGDVFATWRYLDYDLSSGSSAEDLTLNGPALGVAIRF